MSACCGPSRPTDEAAPGVPSSTAAAESHGTIDLGLVTLGGGRFTMRLGM